MNTLKKSLVIALAGVMAVAALALTGCFGIGGGGNGGSSGSKSAMVGTWKLAAAFDYSGSAYDISAIGSDSVVLKVTSETEATFYYFDDDPYPGTLSHDSSRDGYYSSDNFEAKAYRLTGSDGKYWEFAFVTPKDGSDPFWYLEVGPSNDYDSIYLAK